MRVPFSVGQNPRPESPKPVRICVGVITRNRPDYLSWLLNSLRKMEVGLFDCIFVIVENNERLTVGTIVQHFADSIENPVFADWEEQIGISFARNRVLEIAYREGAELLAFVDDDETVSPDWLRQLVAAKLERRLDLVGGPVRLHPPGPSIGRWRRTVWRGCEAINRRQEARANRLLANDNDGTIPLATNNWLADLKFLELEGLRFDEQLGLSGGEDTKLFVNAKARGAKSGWARSAIVSEWLPEERLTFKYQYRSSRDRSTASFHAKYPTRSLRAAMRGAFSAIGKGLSVPVYTLLAVFDRGASLVCAVRAWGFAVGRLRAAVGAHSQHYRLVTGR